MIEHVADTARWLSEVRRVLAPTARLLTTTSSHGCLPLAVRGLEPYADPLGDHLHLYTRRSPRGLLTEFGLTEIRVRTADGVKPRRRSLLARTVR